MHWNAKLTPVTTLSQKPKRPIPSGKTFFHLKETLAELQLHTVCEEAKCPNRTECWSRGSLALQILGKFCTRRCGFCAEQTAKPLSVDALEPEKICLAVKELALSHIVLTAPARDDLPDGGAEQFAKTVRLLKKEFPNLVVEILISDLQGKEESLQTVLESEPHIFNHNIETVKRLTPRIRSKATYECSLFVLRFATRFSPKVKIKSGFMVGLGENWGELLQTLSDLKNAGVQYLTIGQYLQPSPHHLPIEKFYSQEEFKELNSAAGKLGFEKVFAGPLVRSSYFADQLHNAKTFSAL